MSKTLELLYGFAPPAAIYITEQSSKPVKNTLIFDIGNPSATAVVPVNNPDKLGADDVPDIDAKAPHVNLSRFYIWFPYAANDSKESERTSDLATYADAANIVVSKGTGNATWSAVKKYSKNKFGNQIIGTYWVLFPKEDSVLDPQQNAAFIISELVSKTPAGNMTWMYVQGVDIPGYAKSTQEVRLFKELPQLAVTSFALSKQLLLEGDSTQMTWSTVNASYVIATPAINIGDPGKKYPANNLAPGVTVTPAISTTQYQLTAYDEHDNHVLSQPINVSVLAPEIVTFEANNTEPLVNGIIMLSWKAKNASTIKMTPRGPAEMPMEGKMLFLMKEDTTFTLTIINANGYTVTKKVKVTVKDAAPPSGLTTTYNMTAIPYNGPAANGVDGAWGYGPNPGADGSSGSNGATGLPGSNTTFNLGTPVEGQYYKIIVSGGAGQDAGNGGNGGTSDLGTGGNGGNGGNGGDGGEAPTCTIFFTDNIVPKNLIAELTGAAGGKKGNGGKGGVGNPHGVNGADGKDGNPGSQGTLIITGYELDTNT